MNPFKSAKESYDERKAARKADKAAKELAKAQAITRKPSDIQNEYKNVCAMAGDKQYRIECLKAELIQLNEKIFKLNQEFTRSAQVHPPEAVPVKESISNFEEKKVEFNEGANEATQ